MSILKPINIRKELLDELLQECKTPPDLFEEGRILKQLTTALSVLTEIRTRRKI